MKLRLRDRVVELEPGKPLLVGIVNAAPDSFSEPPGARALDDLVARAHAMVEHGAAIVDVGGESGRTDREAVSEEDEIARVLPLVERLVADGLTVSVDTWRRAPARGALDAGAAIVNDVSGLADPALAELCAEAGAGLVITHTRASPKEKTFPDYGGDVMADVRKLLTERMALARSCGLDEEGLVLDPGLDLAKTPAESVEILRRLRSLEALGRPLLLAVSRKDFLGALTGRPPAERDAATLATLEPALDLPAALIRVHDVRAAADFLRVRAALRGEAEPPACVLADPLRREAAA